MLTKRSTLGGGALLALGAAVHRSHVALQQPLRGWRLDLTPTSSTRTAPAPSEILKDLKEPINLYFFFSEKAASQCPSLKTYGMRVREFLRGAGGALERQAAPARHRPAAVLRRRGPRLRARRARACRRERRADRQLYFGLAGTNSTDGQAAIEFFDPAKEEFLEYDVVKLIYQLANPEEARGRLAVEHAHGARLRSTDGPRARAVGGLCAGAAAVRRAQPSSRRPAAKDRSRTSTCW